MLATCREICRQYVILVVLTEEITCDQQTLDNRAGFDKNIGKYVHNCMAKSGLLNVQTDLTNRRRKLVTMTA